MMRQYGAQRFQPSLPMLPVQRGRGKHKHTEYVPQANDFGYRHRVGTIPVGTIVYLQDCMTPFGKRENVVCRNPWIVEAWLNREYYPCVQGKPSTTYTAEGHTAMVRSLRDGRVQRVADWMILQCVDAGLERN